MPEKVYTVEDACRITGVSAVTIGRLLRRGCCPSAFRFHRSWVLDPAALATLIHLTEARKQFSSKPST